MCVFTRSENQLVWTSCNHPNGPVWLHRSRLHAPLLQCRSAVTSSTRLTPRLLFLFILMSRKHYFSCLRTSFHPSAQRLRHQLSHQYARADHRRPWDWNKKRKSLNDGWCWFRKEFNTFSNQRGWVELFMKKRTLHWPSTLFYICYINPSPKKTSS